MGFLVDVLIVLGFTAFMGLCALYVYLADRMVSGR